MHLNQPNTINSKHNTTITKSNLERYLHVIFKSTHSIIVFVECSSENFYRLNACNELKSVAIIDC